MKKIVSILFLLIVNLTSGIHLYAQDTICYGGSDTLSLLSSNSNYRYRWLSRSLPSSSWDTIYNWGTTTSYIIHNITNSREVICQCDTNSNGISDLIVLNKTIIVLGLLQPGFIGSSDTICFGQSPNQLSLLSDATGGGDSYYYYWQQSNNDTSFTNIWGENNLTYSPHNLTSDKYYRMGFVSRSGCGTVYSNSVHINVLPQLQPASIAIPNSSPICYNTVPDSLYIDSFPVGGDGNYSYQWQTYMLGTWVDIPGFTGLSYQPSALSNTTHYRLKITNNCGIVYSNSVTVTVWMPLQNPIIASSSTTPVCMGTAPDSLYMTTQPTGGDGNFTYQWQVMDSGIWVDISNAQGSTYTPYPLSDTTSFRLKTISSCGITNSPSVTIPVYPFFNVGSLDSNFSVCYQTSTNLNFTTMPSGGSGLFAFQWLSSADGVSFFPITNATSDNYTTPNLTNMMYYRVEVTPLTCSISDTTNYIVITPYSQFLPGSIIGGDTVCSGDSSANLHLNVPCIGGALPYTYQWQSSLDGINFTNLPNANTTSYSPNLSNLLADTIILRYYRLAFTSNHGCGTVYSPDEQITILPQLHPAVLGSTTTEPICYNATPNAISIVAVPRGFSGFANQWQVKEGDSWVDITGETGLSYQPGPLTSTTQFRVASTSNDGCGVVYSQPYTIYVYPLLNVGLLDTNTFACHNSSATVSFLQYPTGGGNSFSFKWYSSLDNINYHEIVGATEDTYTTEILNVDTYYKAFVSSNYGCSADTTSAILVRILDPFVGGEINLEIDSICEGTKPHNTLYMTRPCQGGGEPYSYQWQQSNNAVDFINIPNSTENVYEPDTLYETTYYRLIQTSNYGCGVDTSGIHTIVVNPLPPKYNIIGSDIVCYSQYEKYYLQDCTSGYDFQWSIQNNSADVIYYSTNNDTVEILWRLPNVTDSIIMRAEKNITKCSSVSKKTVTTMNLGAPPRTNVVRKPNSNILVCKESSDSLNYQWGYTIRATNTDVYIENSNHRYVLLPHDFDNLTYHYWVELSPSKYSPCYSLSYYEPSNDEDIIIPELNKVFIPSSARGVVNITIENAIQEAVYCQVYSLSGVMQCNYLLGEAEFISHSIRNLKSGNTYIVRVIIGTEVFTQRTFVQ